MNAWPIADGGAPKPGSFIDCQQKRSGRKQQEEQMVELFPGVKNLIIVA
jgi:hypothetical protein